MKSGEYDKKVIFEQRPEVSEAVSSATLWRKKILGKRGQKDTDHKGCNVLGIFEEYHGNQHG